MATQGDEAKPANNRPILTPFPVPDQLFASYDDSAVRRALWDPEEYSKSVLPVQMDKKKLIVLGGGNRSSTII